MFSFRTSARVFAALLVLALPALLLPSGLSQEAAAAGTAPAAGPSRYFPETAHLVQGAFFAFYQQTGGAARWGAPLTEQYEESGQVFQIFERGALQAISPAGPVAARALGSELVAGHPAAPPISVGAAGPDGLFINETGHTVASAFIPLWQGANGWARLGNPITDRQDEGGQPAQYFEYGHLVADATALMGVREQLQDNVRNAHSPFAPVGRAPAPGALYVDSTRHNITGGFLEVYQARGGAVAFGPPLTDEVVENGLTVQYFAAGKLSWAIDRPAGQQVQVEALGRAWMAGHSVPAAALAPAPPPTPTPLVTDTPTATVTALLPTAIPPTASATATPAPSPTATPSAGPAVPAGWQLVGRGQTTYKGSSPERTHNLSLAARRLDNVTVPAGGIFSFNRTLGPDGEKAGFVKGLIIYNGRTIEGVGGGICQVASTFFRAAFNSGFDIVERHPHSYRVSWYEPPAGFDATVFSDERVDFRFRNNLPAPILIHTVNDRKAGTLAVLIYSAARQPFTVSMDGPYTSNRVAHGPALYENDPKLPAGTIKQVEHAKDGLDAVVYRVFTDRATGKVLRKERFFSRYVPWRDIYKRGTGKTNTNPNGSGIATQKP